MATTKYTYSIQNDFPNHVVAPDRLIVEIQTSAIIIALDNQRIGTTGDDCDIWFKDALSSGDEATLDALVAAHSGEPLPDEHMQADGVPLVAVAPNVGDERVFASHNFCDPCSWYGESIRVNDETLTDSGDGLTFASLHVNWIDMVSGRAHDSEYWVQRQQAENPLDPHGYAVVVKVDGVAQVMREPFEATGGDFEVLWDDGRVVFFNSQDGKTVTASYSYAGGSTWFLAPEAGKTLRVLDAETDFSDGAIMTDGMYYSVWAGAPGSKVCVQQDYYKRAQTITQEARGAYPQCIAIGASPAEKQIADIREFRRKSRGMKYPIQGVPFKYATSRDLPSSVGAELRVGTIHGRAFIGECVTITFYCVSE